MRGSMSTVYIHVYTCAAIANETKEVVQKEEEEATVKAMKTQEIADSAERDLAEALPALVRRLYTIHNIIVHQHVSTCT